MNIDYPLIIPSIGHGATDLIDLPLETISYNLLSCIIIYHLNYDIRKVILIFSSIIHISNDFKIKNKYLASALFHIIWLKKPIISKLYLSFVHTPLHYIEIFKNKKQSILKLFLGSSISLLGTLGMVKKIDIKIEKKMGKLWWVFPILPHIYLTQKIKKVNKMKKINKFLNKEIIKFINNK
jgi:hypothetical protein